jgi:uncharacterized protein
MQLISKQKIDHFLNCQSIAIVGASRNKKSFSTQVASHLDGLGYDLWYVNPGFESQETEKQQVQYIEMLPAEVNHILVLTNKTQTESVLKKAVLKGIQNVWIQQQSETPEALEQASLAGLNLVYGQCIFMHTNPEGIHKFHHRLRKLFGTLPK